MFQNYSIDFQTNINGESILVGCIAVPSKINFTQPELVFIPAIKAHSYPGFLIRDFSGLPFLFSQKHRLNKGDSSITGNAFCKLK